jgi:hypothetical protein
MARVLLGGVRDSGGSAAVYKTANAFEIDELEGTSGVRRRVFFEDVFLVTYHREIGTAFALILGGVCLVLGLATLALFVEGLRSKTAGSMVGAGIVGLLTAPFLLVFLNRVIRKKDVITIFGRHGRARMEFEWRKTKARQVFLDICKAVRSSRPPAQRPRPQAPRTPAPGPELEPPVDPSLA